MSSFEEYRERFKKLTDVELQDTLNKDCGNPGWVAARGFFLSALREEFESRGLDYSVAQAQAKIFYEQKKKLQSRGERKPL
ncbi:hypothetical protein COU78_01320 [Candidatus Peregrinibacteria bacterium CG10_big_fil_rev_8_21_14_0_10_49_24]|nr:MAG: hypothetical protein COV83_04285 [Candidatus Peregrinibacteria bacterium CG11_big_fil_rev_8_21_14_0_20_49_14]PIR51365.1 MAG: hypothetical protein COU78_01320 [Candidatus Peregrinibacteria bacterium CG10_big_fil_rev_8_21_14_0_10_49_24]PJA68129.1 MAG: hypothetical protein CO157_01135 [Candidatus Peregrinibacteria bacterium CG_4_9_14_3_um_filter_49_12]